LPSHSWRRPVTGMTAGRTCQKTTPAAPASGSVIRSMAPDTLLYGDHPQRFQGAGSTCRIRPAARQNKKAPDHGRGSGLARMWVSPEGLRTGLAAAVRAHRAGFSIRGRGRGHPVLPGGWPEPPFGICARLVSPARACRQDPHRRRPAFPLPRAAERDRPAGRVHRACQSRSGGWRAMPAGTGHGSVRLRTHITGRGPIGGMPVRVGLVDGRFEAPPVRPAERLGVSAKGGADAGHCVMSRQTGHDGRT
jgi:hypothetical protein